MLSRLMTVREQIILGGLAAAIILGTVTLYLKDDRALPPQAVLETTEATATSTTASTPTAPPATPAGTPPTPTQTTAPKPIEKPTPVRVAIMGAVRKPGLYDLLPGTRLKKLLEVAGGPTKLADLNDINLAATVIDTATLTIPSHPETATEKNTFRRASRTPVYNPAPYTHSGIGVGLRAAAYTAPNTPFTPATATASLVNLNRATTTQLESLPGVGPVTAAKIIAYRQQQPFTTIADITNIHGIGPKTLETLRPLVTVQ